MSYDEEESGQLGIPAGGKGAELPAKSNSPHSDAAWGHALSRRGGTARRTHVGRQLSWSTKPKGWAIPESMPAGVSLSPMGDLSDAKQREAVAVFPTLKKTGSRVKASQEIPLKEKFAK